MKAVNHRNQSFEEEIANKLKKELQYLTLSNCLDVFSFVKQFPDSPLSSIKDLL